MGFKLEKIVQFCREFALRFGVRRNEGPIDSVKKVYDFAATRAAFVAQMKLYGYLKTRMGTRYVSMFEDDVFIESVNIAKMHIFAACLSDLTVFCVARATAGSWASNADREAMARECYRLAIAENADRAPDAGAVDAWLDAFEHRLGSVHWENAAATGEVFEASPEALYEWAPIAPELKRYDARIVRNSIRFAWNEVRIDFRKRLDAAAVQHEMAGTTS